MLAEEQHEDELPSQAFCKAIDNEQEYDVNDVMASGNVDQSKKLDSTTQMQVRCAICHTLPSDCQKIDLPCAGAKDECGDACRSLDIDRPPAV